MLITHEMKPLDQIPCIAALGFFDGVHLGHRAVLTTARQQSLRRGAACAVFTFDLPGHTDRVVSKSDLQLIQSVTHRDELLEELGVDRVFTPHFEDFYNFTPEEFVEKLLIGVMHCVGVVCGENYHFGKKGAGDAALLRQLCEARGVSVTVVPPVMHEGEWVSSTRIRRCIAEGKIALANKLLGTPYRVEGEGVLCDGCWLQPLPQQHAAPKNGRYCSRMVTVAGAFSASTEVYTEGETVLLRTEIPAQYPFSAEDFTALELLAEIDADSTKIIDKH